MNLSLCCRYLHSRLKSRTVITSSLYFIFCTSVLAEVAPTANLNSEILSADIESLLNMEVSSVSRSPEERKKSAAAISVLTSEDIKRSGARSVPEALRLIPGVTVARIDANKWAVSIRGFNNQNANKLLVMIDGRSIYNPLLSGTIWQTKDVFIEDVDRIEVVRGPGGSSWGSNAVNGVINIITKNSRDTQGGLLSAGGGSEERAFSSLRYGMELGEETFLRIYGKYYNRDEGYMPGGVSDDSHNSQGGFRLDSGTEDNLLTVQGSLDGGEYDGKLEINEVVSRDYVFQTQWERKFSKTSSFTANGYYAKSQYEASLIGDDRDTGEINLIYSAEIAERLLLTSGLQYRISDDKITNSPIVALAPISRTIELASLFTKAKYEVIPEELYFAAGARFEHSDIAPFEFQPDVSVSWTPNEEQTFWGSFSRAVRIPTRLEEDFLLQFPGTETIFTGNRNLASENLYSYQLGYRQSINSSTYIDIATFYNVYEDLIFGQGTTITNSGHGNVYGVEIAPSYKLAERSVLSAGYSLLLSDVRPVPSANNDPLTASSTNDLDESTPQHQAFIKASLQLAEEWQFDCDLRYVSRTEAWDVSHYIVGDARIAWQADDSLELAIVGQNLFRAHHFEFDKNPSSEVQQGVYGQIRFVF